MDQTTEPTLPNAEVLSAIWLTREQFEALFIAHENGPAFGSIQLLQDNFQASNHRKRQDQTYHPPDPPPVGQPQEQQNGVDVEVPPKQLDFEVVDPDET